jgi:hypothetical protein
LTNVTDITATVRPRWVATVSYVHDDGIRKVKHAFNEIEDLDEIIERGPDWNCIKKITVRLSDYRRTANHTVEKSETL